MWCQLEPQASIVELVNKKLILGLFLQLLEQDLSALKTAALATYDAATNEESQPENQYDTRALEASYLAGAQAKRLAEVEDLIFLFRGTQVRNFSGDDTIDVTALVELSSHRHSQWVFLMPKGGGLKVTVDGVVVQTVTPASPLGEALMGLGVGDTADVEDATVTREFTIKRIF